MNFKFSLYYSKNNNFEMCFPKWFSYCNLSICICKWTFWREKWFSSSIIHQNRKNFLDISWRFWYLLPSFTINVEYEVMVVVFTSPYTYIVVSQKICCLQSKIRLELCEISPIISWWLFKDNSQITICYTKWITCVSTTNSN